MDCVLVPILRPTKAEGAFFCRKKFPALNCQVISNMDHEITNILIYPGSYTDIAVWNSSFLKRYIEALRRNEHITSTEGKYYLIGQYQHYFFLLRERFKTIAFKADTGYNPSNVLLTKLKNVKRGSVQAYFNDKLGHTRSWVEQTYGQWINTWRIISKEHRPHYSALKVRNIIIATAVLHNFEIRNGYLSNYFGEQKIVFL